MTVPLSLRPTRLPLGRRALACLAACLVMLALGALPGYADEAPPEVESPRTPPPAPAPAAPAPAAPAPAEPVPAPPAGDAVLPPAQAAPASGRLGIRPGTHRVTLFGGQLVGNTALSATIDTAPLSTTAAQVRIDLDNSSTYGLRYSYQLRKHWGAELTLSRTQSSLSNQVAFDRAEVEAIVDQSSVEQVKRPALLARLAEHAGPYDIDVTMTDFGATYVFNPKGRFVAEAGAGLGWAFSHVDKEPAIFEQLVHDVIIQPALYTIANEIDDPTNGMDCPADNDPCVAIRSADGLTFHVGGGVSVAFNDHVHLRFDTRFRFMNAVTDPGDTLLTIEGSLGVAFLFGGGGSSHP